MHDKSRVFADMIRFMFKIEGDELRDESDFYEYTQQVYENIQSPMIVEDSSTIAFEVMKLMDEYGQPQMLESHEQMFQTFSRYEAFLQSLSNRSVK